MALIRNHTNKVPLPSHRDVYKALTLKVKNIVATTEGKYNSLLINNNRFTIKDNNLLKAEAKKVQDKFISLKNEMKKDFIKANHVYKHINKDSPEFKKAIANHYQKDENMLHYYRKFNATLPKNMKLKLYNRVTNSYI